MSEPSVTDEAMKAALNAARAASLRLPFDTSPRLVAQAAVEAAAPVLLSEYRQRIEALEAHFRSRAHSIDESQAAVSGAAWHYGMGAAAIYLYAADSLAALAGEVNPE